MTKYTSDMVCHEEGPKVATSTAIENKCVYFAPLF